MLSPLSTFGLEGVYPPTLQAFRLPYPRPGAWGLGDDRPRPTGTVGPSVVLERSLPGVSNGRISSLGIER